MNRLSRKNNLGKIDWVIIVTIVLLFIYGLIAIAAACATPVAEDATLNEKIAAIDFSLVFRQAIWFAVGTIAILIIMFMDYATLKDFSALIFGIFVAILALLFLLATITNNTVSWYKFGSVGFQPSELCKISLILILARYYGNRSAEAKLSKVKDLLPPLIFTGMVFILVA